MEPTPFMEAMYKWAMADSNDCDREWAVCLALARERETASGSPPTNPTSHLHDHAPVGLVTASTTTRSTAPLRAPSDGVSTTTPAAAASTTTSSDYFHVPSPRTTTTPVASASSDITRDDLSPGARRMYDYLVGASTSLEDAHDTVDNGGAAVAVLAPITCSTVCLRDDTSMESTKSPPVMALASSASNPASPATISATADFSTVLGVPLELDTVQDAVNIDITELAAPKPTTCLLDCSSCDASVSAAVLVSPARPSSPTTTDGVVPEHCYTDLEPAADDCTGTENSMDMCLTPAVSTVASEACSVNPVLGLGASAFSLMSAPYFVNNVDASKLSEIRLPPWHPPWQGIRYKEMFQVHDFILESTQIMLRTVRNPWPPPVPHMSACIQIMVQLECQDIPFMPWTILFHLPVESVKHARNKIGRELCRSSSLSAELLVFCFTSCQILYLHGTLDNMQLAGDWQVLKIMGLKWSATLIVIIFALGVQGAQLKPTVVKCSDILCPATHTLIAITNVDLLLGELLTWVFVNCHFAKAHFQWTLAVQRSTSSSRFLATLIGEATVHQKHSCTRVLADAIHKRWISGHLLRGNPHYSELMKWPSNHSHLHSESRFYAPGHIILICYEPVQWKIPWTIPLLPLKFCFQFYYAQSEFVYIFENFQWTIAWLFSCPLLVKLVELKPWPSLSYQFSSPVSWSCSCQQIGDWLLPCSPQRVFLSSSENFQWEIARLLDLIEWKPRNSGAYLWASYLIASACGPVAVFMWLQFVITCNLSPKAELLANITIELKPWHSWELFPCNSVVTSCLCGALHILISSVLTLECINTKSSPYFEVPIWDTNCIMVSTSGILYSGELYWLLALYSSCDQLVTEDAIYFGSQPLEWKIPWCFCPCHVVLSSKWLRMQPCGPEMMSWEIASSNDRAFTYSPRVLISWDPGGSDHVLATAWTVNPLRFLHLTWDPGGCAQHRLEGKPNLKEGGLSATILHCRWLDKWASILGPVAPKTDYKYIVTCSRVELAWNERTDGLGLEGEDRLGVGRVCACYSFFLLRFLAPSPLFL